MRRGKLYLGCLAALGLLYGLPVRFGVVLGESMAPTFHHGQFYLLERGYYRRHSPARNEVVVFKRNGTRYVKRVAAVAGDRIYVTRNVELGADELVQAGEVDRLRKLTRRWPWFQAMKPIERRVPAGHCYVLGDHLTCSEDSRLLGFIPLEEIEGRVLFTPSSGGVVERLALAPGAKAF